MKVSGEDVADWFRGSKMGYSFFDKLIIFFYILNATIVFFTLVGIYGDERATKTILKNPTIINWIPAKKVRINIDDVSLYIPVEIDYLLLVKSDWETKERKFVSNLPMNKGVIIDVGANIGHYTNLLAKKYPRNKVYAIEASSTIFQNLKLNCELNKLTNAVLYNKAISDKDNQTIDFFERGCLSTINEQFLKDWLIPKKYINKIKVKTMTLDSLIQKEKIDQVNLLKIDIEGEEIRALNGASDSLNRGKISNLVIEYHRYSDRDKILKLLEDLGYSCTTDERPKLFDNQDYANGHIFGKVI